MSNKDDLLILGIGISQYKTDGVLRFEHFCNIFGLPHRIIGDGKVWRGGNITKDPGGGQKINEIIEAIKDMDNRLIVICDTYDLIPVAGREEIVEKFNRICGPNNIIISSELYCWPDKRLVSSYPKISSKYKYLNSGFIMGYSDHIYDIIKKDIIMDNDDDQLFFTKKYITGEKIILDYDCQLAQTLCGESQNDVVLHKNRIYNKYTNSYPSFLHGNGPAKAFLNHLENYLEVELLKNCSFTLNKQYRLTNCPKVFFALYVDSSKPEELNIFLTNLAGIDYDNKDIYVYDRCENNDTQNLVEMLNFTYKGNVTTYIFSDFKESNCEYYFLLEQRCCIIKSDLLHELIPCIDKYHRIIAPLLIGIKNKTFSNFWGALDDNGYYARSDNYLELINYGRRGLWNVPYVSGAILIERSIITNFDIMRTNEYGDPDMQLCCNFRKDTLFMYMVNFNNYGNLS